MKFTAKTAILDAFQWFPFLDEARVRTMSIENKDTGAIEEFGCLRPLVLGGSHFPHLNGQQLLRPGDYVITHDNGSQDISRKEWFEAQYVPHFEHQLVVNIVLVDITVYRERASLPVFPFREWNLLPH